MSRRVVELVCALGMVAYLGGLGVVLLLIATKP